MVWRFCRWHHHVNYRPFKKNKLVRREGVEIPEGMNNYGMRLVQIVNGDAAAGAFGEQRKRHRGKRAADAATVVTRMRRQQLPARRLKPRLRPFRQKW
jgi:hypothetical protein